MELAMILLKQTLLLLIDVVQIAFMLRAIMSWFDTEGTGRLTAFLTLVTEPFILPVRAICVKKNWFQQTPLDMPFLIAMVLLSGLTLLIGIF